MKPKPKIKRIKSSNTFLAFYKSKNGENFTASGETPLKAMNNWYKKFGIEFGYG